MGAQADALIESLIAARLVVASETESGEDDLEIVHEGGAAIGVAAPGDVAA